MNEIFLSGTVGSSFWEEEYFTEASVRDMLAGLTGPLTVNINSGGGIATEGQAIYTLLKDYAGEVTVVVNGIAASAASLIAMAGDDIVMPLGAILMIHDPATWAVDGRGTEDDHLKAAKQLRVMANSYAAIYAARAGITTAEAREVMRAETYYDGDAAVAAGFATKTDDSAPAAAAALFDYRIYAHAPSALRAVGDALGKRPSARAIAAMLSGTTKSKQEQTMKRKPNAKGNPVKHQMIDDQDPALENDDDTTLEDQADDDLTAEDEEETTAEEDDDLTAEEEEETTAEEDEAEEVRATAIMNLCKKRKVSTKQAARYIAMGLTAQQVQGLHPLKNGNNMPKMNTSLPRARIIRDERDTRRTGMTAALVAQLSGGAPSHGAGRAYMDMPLYQLAQAASGQQVKMARNSGQIMTVFMDASHSTSDFPAIFQNALNKVLLDRYSEFQPSYRQIAKQKNFRDFRPMPLVRSGDFPMPVPVPESGEIKWGTFSESGETAIIVPYARGLTISRQMMVNDDLGAISELLDGYGETLAYFEEHTFYASALGAKLSDGKDLFHADHGNLASSASGIDPTSISLGRSAMRKQKSKDGLALSLSPSILLVGPDKETEAEMVVAAITPTDSEAVNPFAGKLQTVVSSEIQGKAWYLLSGRAPCWVFGYLEGQEGPRVRTEEPFGQQGFKMTVEHDFGLGAADFRGGYKNTGA
ncbi:head maturation protease, ClpP-related [Ketogulonicigenium vulgare]|uniref:head maturation protease, ClpP-related n=1 Tax=Ketogulonicigenium vulgare TaxID=92945 RepID=UPI0023591F09|nr:head maturation protease, ClpP-related [Ketogulonicigenium vulgare]